VGKRLVASGEQGQKIYQKEKLERIFPVAKKCPRTIAKAA
jgi:hypothetical protein